MKRIELCGFEFQRLRVHCRGKKIDGIPDASDPQHAVGTGQHGHRYASRESALHASRYWVRVDRKPGAQLLCCNRKAFDHATLGGYAKVLRNLRHSYFMLAREDFPEPTDATRNSE